MNTADTGPPISCCHCAGRFIPPACGRPSRRCGSGRSFERGGSGFFGAHDFPGRVRAGLHGADVVRCVAAGWLAVHFRFSCRVFRITNRKLLCEVRQHMVTLLRSLGLRCARPRYVGVLLCTSTTFVCSCMLHSRELCSPGPCNSHMVEEYLPLLCNRCTLTLTPTA